MIQALLIKTYLLCPEVKKLRKPGSLGSQKIFKNRGFDRQFEILVEIDGKYMALKVVLTENVYTTAENRDYGLKSHGQFLISDSGSR